MPSTSGGPTEPEHKMPISLKVCNDSREWDVIVDKCPQKTLFHRWDFLKLMEKHSRIKSLGRKYESRLCPLIGLKRDKAIGLYPIFFYNSPFPKYVFSPPLHTGVTYQGPLMVGYDQLTQSKKEKYFFEFQKSVDEYISSGLKANMIKIKTSPKILDSRPFSWNNYQVEPLYNYELNLNNGLNNIWNNFDKTIRKNIKGTESKGVKVREGSKQDISLLFNALEKRYKEQGIPLDVSYDYLQELYGLLQPNNLKIFVVEKDGEYLTGVLLFAYNDKVQTWIGMTTCRISGLYPNDLLLWEIIKWGHEHNFGRCEITYANDYRLCKYKSKTNPEISTYFSCTKTSPFIAFMRSLTKIRHPKESNKK